MAFVFSAQKPPSRYEEVIAVLTSKSVARILSDGGTSSWTLNRVHARKHRYVICVCNGRHIDPPTSENHGSAFLVGRVKEVVTSPEHSDRWLITFSEYAQIDVPNAWQGWRNPVRYTTANVLGVDLTSLVFLPMPQTPPADSGAIPLIPAEPQPLTIEQAKKGLASTFGVPIEAIEITIRG